MVSVRFSQLFEGYLFSSVYDEILKAASLSYSAEVQDPESQAELGLGASTTLSSLQDCLRVYRDNWLSRQNFWETDLYCDCKLPKLVGTVVGEAGIGKTSLVLSFQSIGLSSHDDRSGRRRAASLPDPGPLPTSQSGYCYVVHTPTSEHFFCVHIFDTTALPNDTARSRCLARSNFVVIAHASSELTAPLVQPQWLAAITAVSPEIPVFTVGLAGKTAHYDLAPQSHLFAASFELGEQGSPQRSQQAAEILRSLTATTATRILARSGRVLDPVSSKLEYLRKTFPSIAEQQLLSVSALPTDEAVATLAHLSVSSQRSGPQGTLQELVEHEDILQMDGGSLQSQWKREVTSMDSAQRGFFINGFMQKGLNVDSAYKKVAKKEKKKRAALEDSVEARTPPAEPAEPRLLVTQALKKSIDKFLKEFKQYKKLDNRSALLKIFLPQLAEETARVCLELGVGEEEVAEYVGSGEDLLFQKIWKKLDKQVEQTYREEDADLADKLSRLSEFLTPKHMDIPPKFWNYQLWDSAIAPLATIDQQINPHKKLSALLQTVDDQAGADDFLPHLIYVIIKAHVPRLQVNYAYIELFASPKVLALENLYYYTSVGIAVSFLLNLSPSSFNMSEADYAALMSSSAGLTGSPVDKPATPSSASGRRRFRQTLALSLMSKRREKRAPKMDSREELMDELTKEQPGESPTSSPGGLQRLNSDDPLLDPSISDSIRIFSQLSPSDLPLPSLPEEASDPLRRYLLEAQSHSLYRALDSAQAVEYLAPRPPGEMLLRPSSRAGSLALSFVEAPGRIRHTLIDVLPSGFRMQASSSAPTRFDDLDDLIAAVTQRLRSPSNSSSSPPEAALAPPLLEAEPLDAAEAAELWKKEQEARRRAQVERRQKLEDLLGSQARPVEELDDVALSQIVATVLDTTPEDLEFNLDSVLARARTLSRTLRDPVRLETALRETLQAKPGRVLSALW